MTPQPAFDHRDAHRFRIGLAPISEDQWFEPVGSDGDPAVRKAQTFAESPDLCWGETPGSRPGQAEALDLLQAHLGLSPVTDGEVPPLRRAAALVDDDLCLMEPGDGGLDPYGGQPLRPQLFQCPGCRGQAPVWPARTCAGFQ